MIIMTLVWMLRTVLSYHQIIKVELSHDGCDDDENSKNIDSADDDSDGGFRRSIM